MAASPEPRSGDDTCGMAGVPGGAQSAGGPSRDTLTEHEQTGARLLAMFGILDVPEFDTESARVFCRFFQVGVRLLPELGWLVGVL
jgi:hypothetical protein